MPKRDDGRPLKRCWLFFLATCHLSLVTASADIVDIGGLDFTGQFTRNPNYNYNTKELPFGTFGPLSTLGSGFGIFSGISGGTPLAMNTSLLYIYDANFPAAHPVMVWGIAGFTFTTTNDFVVGPIFLSTVIGTFQFDGNGFHIVPGNRRDNPMWQFETAAPGGPILMKLRVRADDGRAFVPESGGTFFLLLFVLTIGAVLEFRKRYRARARTQCDEAVLRS